MKLKLWTSKLCAGLAVLVGVAVMATKYGTAQEAPKDVVILREGPASPEMQVKPLDVIRLKTNAGELAVDGAKKRIVAIQGGQPDKMHAIHEAASALNEAEGDDARAEAKENLTKLLDEYFEADMERRERELAEVEERVNKLRSTLQRRREKKGDILDLQIEVLLNEADGLGFFGGEAFGMPGNPLEFKFHTFSGPQPPIVGQPVPVVPGAPGAPAAVPAPPQPSRRATFERGGGRGGYGGGRGGGYGGFGGYGRGGGGYGREYGGDGDDGSRGRDPQEMEARQREREEEQERERNRERERDRDRDREEGEAPVR
jgi:hypothetical protein